MHILLGALVCCGALSQTNCMQQKNLSQKYQNGLKWVQDDQQEGIPRTGNAQSFASNFMKKNWPKGKDSTAGTVEHDLANLHALIITKPDMFRFPKRQNSIYQQANANLVRALLFQQAQLDRLLVTLANERLFKAIAHNSPENVQVELDTGAQVNTRNERDDTPLNYACYSYRRDINTTEIVARLIRAGADVNARNRYKFTPLLQTCLSPDPNVRNKCGKTPLWFACRYGYLEIAKLLLEKGANPNVPNSNNEMPLMLTCWSGHLEIAKLLLLYKADPNVLDKTGWNALEVACLHDNLELVTLLLSRQANLPTSLYSGWTLAIQRRIQLVADWTNRQGNQPVTQQEFEQFIQHPGDFATLLFRRNGLLTKIMNTLTEQQRTRLITIFFEHISGRERRAYLAPDIERITKTIISFK